MTPVPIYATNTLVDEKLKKAKQDYKERIDMEYILDFFNANQKWYDDTKEKISQLSKNLPKDLTREEIIIKLYGWIEDDTKISGSLVKPYAEDIAYNKADSIRMVFIGQIDLYKKIMNWD